MVIMTIRSDIGMMQTQVMFSECLKRFTFLGEVSNFTQNNITCRESKFSVHKKNNSTKVVGRITNSRK